MEFPKEINNDLDLKIAQLVSNLCVVQQIFYFEFSLSQGHCGTARACSKNDQQKIKNSLQSAQLCVIPSLLYRWCFAAHPEMGWSAPMMDFTLWTMLSKTPGCKKRLFQRDLQLLSSQVLVHGQQTCLFCANPVPPVNMSQQNLSQRLWLGNSMLALPLGCGERVSSWPGGA